jgi:DNA-binding XRE family transcriptional regulator
MYEELRRLRGKRNVTQEEMAKLLGHADKSSYSLKERGLRKFSVNEAHTIADFFGLSIESIFFAQEVVNMTNENG